MSEPVVVSLHHKTHVAELWHGKSGCAEDFVGNEIPGGYVQCLGRLLELLWAQGLHPAGEPVNLAVSTSIWARAGLLAKEQGLPIRYVIAPFGSLPWKHPELVTVGVTDRQADNYIRNIYRDAEYVLHPRTAAAYCALQTHRVTLGEATPALILATESPFHAQQHILAQLGKQGPLSSVIEGSRQRFLEY